MSKKLLNCPNCGAPIDGEKCSYCGTVFLDFAAIEDGAPSYVKFKVANNYIIAKLVLTNLEITPEAHVATYKDGLGMIKGQVLTGYSCHIHMDAEAVAAPGESLVTLVVGGDT